MADPSLLKLFSPAAREVLQPSCQQVQFERGAVLAQAGQACDSLWFIGDGIVDVGREDPITAEWIPHRVLRRGDLYGTHSLSDAVHHVTLRALTDVRLTALSAEALTAAADTLPEVTRLVADGLSHPGTSALLQRLANRMEVDLPALQALAAALESESWPDGSTVQAPDAPVNALRVVEAGLLDGRTDGDPSGDRRLGPGHLLGASALLLDVPSPERFTAIRGVQTRAAPADRVRALCAEHPALRTALAHTALADTRGLAPAGAPQTDRAQPSEEVAGQAAFEAAAPTVPPPALRRMPFVRQRDDADCGAACVRMIHEYYGHEINARHSRRLARVSRYGSSLLDLAQAAERLGYVAAGVQVRIWAELEQVDLPAIAHVGGNHFVVIWRVRPGSVDIGDPALHNSRIDRDAFLERFGGFLLLLRPTDAVARLAAELEEDVAHAPGAASPRRLWPFVQPQQRVLGHILLASLLLQLSGLVAPMMVQVIIDRVLMGGDVGLLTAVLVGLVCIAVAQGLVMLSRAWLIIHASLQVHRTVLESIYSRVIGLSHAFFNRFTTGDLVRRFGEVDIVRTFIVDNALTIAIDLLMLGTYGAVLLLFDVSLALLYLAGLSIAGISVLLLARPVRGHTAAYQQKMARLDGHVIDSFKGIEPIKALSLEGPFSLWYRKQLVPAIHEARLAGQWSATAGVVAGTIQAVNTAVLLWWGANLVLDGALSIGQLMAFLMLASQLAGPFMRLLTQWRSFQATLASLHRIGDLMEEESELDQHERRGAMVSREQLHGEIRLESLSFRYTDDPQDSAADVLHEISLHISPGEVIGVVGRSGCGKSTLARLLLRFHEPSGGRVVLDDINLRDLDPASVRRSIGLVTQDAFLYRASIRDNIACGRDVDEEAVVQAARAAGAYDFINELPYGFETLIGEQGMQLSGGQRQRIVIARALCTQPSVLIFDEATAALDPLVEAEIHESLREVIRGRTTLIMAHRLHVLRNADRIAVLDRGRLVELGTHDALMAAGGLYHQMYTAAPDWQTPRQAADNPPADDSA